MDAASGRRLERPRPQAREDTLSSEPNRVIRLPQPRGSASPELLRQRLGTVLADLVERAVVPRLIATYAGPNDAPGVTPPPSTPVAPHTPPTEDVLAFTALLLRGREGEADEAVNRLRADGVTPASITLHLLTGAARHLGDLWSADAASFADVTQATFTLQRIFRDLAEDLPTAQADAGRRALLIATPGEQHGFGLEVLAAFFRAAGWTVGSPTIRRAAEIGRRVADARPELLGLSLGADIHLTRLTRCIALARRASPGGRLVVMVGGPIFVARPELVASVGADGTAPDAAGALARARELLAERA